MELVSLAKEVFQTIAEHAASYRLGQSALRHLDRSLWVVEKCARWAVPPPLDQDERPQPELVRPLPWVFFLVMLVTLRITREGISLLNLVMGKPPLRSADVVMYIQSKRRYLRTLKYQGNRMMRARTSTAIEPQQSWSNALHSLFEFTMCFRRQSHYGNNNTTRISNNDEVLVVKKSKRGREPASIAASTSETTMERLIEKMMVDLDADSDEDSSFTLTNVTSPKSDRSDFTTESDQDTIYHNNIPDKPAEDNHQPTDSPYSANMSAAPCSTPERLEEQKEPETPPRNEKTEESFVEPEIVSSKEETQKFIQQETSPSKIPRSPNNEQKIANGRTVKSVPSKKKGSLIAEKDRRNSDGKNIPGNNTM
ncbi:hypothetical protein PYW08_005549 [Mythimna loreyi]|uniref:Uncharacterized protein n=1 Tax=Mythimna loreyi TaxID=667449 RepID=A0ACC2QGZ8_9NEOP|nr:hypothetical protein PYW08_005549 [Mythimna loreyi]